MRIEAGALRRTVERVFAAAGCAAEAASCVAGHLVDSNLCGHVSRGEIRVSRTLGYMREDRIVDSAALVGLTGKHVDRRVAEG